MLDLSTGDYDDAWDEFSLWEAIPLPAKKSSPKVTKESSILLLVKRTVTYSLLTLWTWRNCRYQGSTRKGGGCHFT